MSFIGDTLDAVLGGGPKAPPAPDIEKMLQQQSQYNRLDQYTPYGSLTYSGPDRNVVNFQLSPEYQNILSGQQGLSQTLLQNAQQRANQLPTSYDFGDASRQAQQSVFQSMTDLLNPEFQRQEESLRQRLANQGLPTNSQAGSTELGIFNDQRNRALTNAARQAVLAGNERQNQLFNQQGANLGQIMQMLGASGNVPTMQNFYSPGSVDVTGAYGLNQQGQLAAFNAANQRQSNILGGLSNLGAAAILA